MLLPISTHSRDPLMATWKKHGATKEIDETNLDLSLGISTGRSYKGANRVGTGQFGRWFNDVGFVHPWSLAARQEKAALEQMQARGLVVGQSSSSLAPEASRARQTAPVIGWPPVRSHRKNILSLHSPKSKLEDVNNEDYEKESKKPRPSENHNDVIHKQQEEKRPTKFVKVNIEGFVVGRKIDLMAQDGYGSLSSTLHRMFNNFLSVENQSLECEMKEKHEATSSKLTLLYEDNEGDRMLVGDVPWEMFIGSVKRLFISNHLRISNRGEEQCQEKKE